MKDVKLHLSFVYRCLNLSKTIYLRPEGNATYTYIPVESAGESKYAHHGLLLSPSPAHQLWLDATKCLRPSWQIDTTHLDTKIWVQIEAGRSSPYLNSNPKVFLLRVDLISSRSEIPWDPDLAAAGSQSSKCGTSHCKRSCFAGGSLKLSAENDTLQDGPTKTLIPCLQTRCRCRRGCGRGLAFHTNASKSQVGLTRGWPQNP